VRVEGGIESQSFQGRHPHPPNVEKGRSPSRPGV
jgi:hypothetical protein